MFTLTTHSLTPVHIYVPKMLTQNSRTRMWTCPGQNRSSSVVVTTLKMSIVKRLIVLLRASVARMPRHT